MRKPFYQLFISHCTGTFTGMLVLAGLIDALDSSIEIYNFQLALMASVFALISLAINRFFSSVKSVLNPSSASSQMLIRRLFVLVMLLSFWVPAVQNVISGKEADKNKLWFVTIFHPFRE